MARLGRVGVIIPMFDSERTIGATLESIRQQTYRDLDIVVVDDLWYQPSSLAPLCDWRTCRRTCSSAYCCGGRRRRPRFYRWSKLPICRGRSRWRGYLNNRLVEPQFVMDRTLPFTSWMIDPWGSPVLWRVTEGLLLMPLQKKALLM